MILALVRHLPPAPFTGHEGDFDRALNCDHEQTLELASVLADVLRFDIGFVSPYRRCLDTAQQVQHVTHRWFEVPELREVCNQDGDTIQGAIRNGTFPEKAFEVRDRVSRFLSLLKSEGGRQGIESAVIVTHGDVVNAFRWCLERLTAGEYRDMYSHSSNKVEPGSIRMYDTRKGMTRVYSYATGWGDKHFFTPAENGMFHRTAQLSFNGR